ncbi:MAG: hypothetical protein IPM63_17100 [Acidobacteriota bacterium]|nr:MAG: hypothetical protein IPM63_17100 [Acidobacteriota bacterium]
MYGRLSTFLKLQTLVSILLIASCAGAGNGPAGPPGIEISEPGAPETSKAEPIDNESRVVHVIVALCDNENQGIVPVSASLGNGEDPDRNLYWGAAFGVRTYFDKSASWKLVERRSAPKNGVLERLIYRHASEDVILVADAYRGDRIRGAIADSLAALAGSLRENVEIEGRTVQIYGGADLVAFVGHNGLMDFELGQEFPAADEQERDAVVLACASRQYFRESIRQAGAKPLLWTTNLMAPEAYILHDAIEGWVADEDDEEIRSRAAKAYSKYQKISLRAANGLLVTGY